MPNLHQITTTGTAQSLGPVEVTRVFDKFAGATNCLVLVKDASVQDAIGIKVWGPASNTKFEVGTQITFEASGPKGKLEYKEYPVGSNKWQINANDTVVRIQGGNAGAQEPHQAPASSGGGYQPRSQAQASHGASANEKPMSIPANEMERRMDSICGHAAEMGTRLVDAYILKGFTKEEAIQMAAGGHMLYPTSWFLEKGW